MANKAPIKTELFRFVTFRSPEQLTYQKKTLRFVTHPNLERSLINSCPVPDEKENTESRLEEFVTQFPSFVNKQEVRNFNTVLFDFANSVQKKKTSLLLIEETMMTDCNIVPLDENQETHLFDALIGEIFTKKSKEVERCWFFKQNR